MIRSGIILTICTILLFCTSAASARVNICERINLDAEFRPRSEFDNRDFSGETGYDAYASMRTRIGLHLENITGNTNLYIMIGDSRMMGYSNPYLTGNPPGPNGFDNNLGVNKVYIEVKDIWRRGTLLKIGRISNDQGRSYIFGSGNWNLFGPRTYDGIKVGFSDDKKAFNLWTFYGSGGDRHWYPVAGDPDKSPDQSKDYKRDHTLTGLDYSLWTKTINFLLFLDLDQKSVTDTINQTTNIALKRTTAAINVCWRKDKRHGHWIDFDAAYQLGALAHEGGNGDISAYMLAGDWSWHLDEPLKLWFGLGFHILSGWEGEQDKVTYFYDNYSSKHKTFGLMDYFKSPTTGMKPKGLQDIILQGGITPSGSLSCNADLHRFTIEKAYQSVLDGSSSHVLGHELDMSLNYSIRNGLSMELGFDLFLPSDDWQGSSGDISTFIYAVMTSRI